jgi:hypothetical protein
MILEPGARIGPYQIVRRLGRGASGIVYQATHPEFGDVAFKVLAAEFVDDDTTRARFVREAHTVVRLRHRNIVTVFEGGVYDDVPFIAMELLAGKTLAAQMAARPPMSLERKLDIVVQLCDGLQFAHERGVIHRDVKPANVWILENGGVKLLDFGTARVLGSTLTRQGGVVGSAAYMAPEQLLGSDVDGRADVFAAGAILYELLTGRRAFGGDLIATVMHRILHETPTPVAELVADVPPEVASAVDAALHKDLSARYQEVADFGSDLRLARYAMPAAPTDAAAAFEDATHTVHSPVAPTVIIPRQGQPPLDGTRIRVVSRALEGERIAVQAEPGLPELRGDDAAAPSAAGIGAWVTARWRAVAAVGVVGIAVATVFAMTRGGSAPLVLLDIRSEPPGAVIEFDGVPTNYRTPSAVSLSSPPKRLRLLASGYETIDTPITPAAGEPTLLTFELRRLVRVESIPSGARIMMDGRDTGLATPADVAVTAGAQPAMVLQGADSWSGSVQMTEAILDKGLVTVPLVQSRRRVADVQPARDTSPVHGAAERLPVAAVSEAAGPSRSAGGPQVAVHVAGLYPFEITGCGRTSAPAARHDLEVAAPCTLRLRAPKYYLDEARRVTAVSGRVEFAAPALARVQLRSKHEGCTLLLNDNAVGSPPVDLELAAGTYRVVIQCRDRAYTIRALTIEPGQSSRRLDDFLQ